MILTTLFLSSAVAVSVPALRIGAENEPIVTAEPSPPGCCSPTFDQSSQRWTVPLRTPANGTYVTTYNAMLDDHSDAVAIQLVVPRNEQLNQEVFLAPPGVADASEGTVRKLWQNPAIIRKSSGQELQFQALQDLGFIMREIRRTDTSPHMSPKVSARSQRAAYLFVRVITNLAEDSWFVVHQDYSKSLAYALQLLRTADSARTCWLGAATCKGIEQLVDQTTYLRENQLGRMYQMIAPTQSQLANPEYCSANSRALLDFYNHFLGALDRARAAEIRKNSGLGESRIASEIAACAVTLAKCPVAASRAETHPVSLAEARSALERAMASDRTDLAVNHLQVVSDLERDLGQGIPPACPVRS